MRLLFLRHVGPYSQVGQTWCQYRLKIPHYSG
jgi:hypothetical protein